MLTTHQLFGELATATISGHSAFLERARREADRGRQSSADLAFGAYIVTRLIEAFLELDTTADGQAGFRWQRDVTVKHIHALPKTTTEVNHLTGILDAIPDVPGASAALAVSLTAYAYFLEHEGRLEEALDILALSARARPPEIPLSEIAAYAFFAGKLNRLLARWEQALVCYAAAEEAGRILNDHTMVLRGRLCQGAVARGQGNLPKARAIGEAVAQEASHLGLAYVQATAYADLGVVYSLQGLPLEAVRARYAAFLLATTPVDRMQALGDLGLSLAEIGAYEQARIALHIVATGTTDFRIRTNAMLELMDLESAVGNRVAFERHRSHAETCRGTMPPSMAVDYHYKVGIGLARFGQLERARANLGIALQAAETYALNAWYFRIEHDLAHLAAPETVARETQGPPELRTAPVVREIELGLREFSAAVS